MVTMLGLLYVRAANPIVPRKELLPRLYLPLRSVTASRSRSLIYRPCRHCDRHGRTIYIRAQLGSSSTQCK